MPYVSQCGLKVRVEYSPTNISHPTTINGTARAKNAADPPTYSYLTLPESDSGFFHEVLKGMSHPLFVTTMRMPAQVGNNEVPMKVVLDFEDPVGKLQDYMIGDMRAELTVDGVTAGLAYLRDFKVKGKGFRVEFSGYRVERTKERQFVFNALPQPGHVVDSARCGGKNQKKKSANGGRHDAGSGDADDERIPNQGLEWAKNALKVPNPDPTKMVGEEYPHGGLWPPHPIGMPSTGVSMIQVLLTVGKKYRTLEKYFMSGATQSTAFYYPPKPPMALALQPDLWVSQMTLNTMTRKSNSVVAGRAAMSNNAKHSLMEGSADVGAEETEIDEIPEDVQKRMLEPEVVLKNSASEDTWRPIGLSSNLEKTPQTKEVEFAARMHMVRVWIFVGLFTPCYYFKWMPTLAVISFSIFFTNLHSYSFDAQYRLVE